MPTNPFAPPFIPAADLALVTPGATDSVVGVDESTGNPRRFPVGFNQGGPGSVSRTLKDKLSDAISVKDFGAKGDGVTDDAAAFASAKTNGGLVNISAATRYKLSSPVVSNDAAAAWFPDPSLSWANLTDSGKFSMWRGRATDAIPNGSNIWRFSDRAFFGYAASAFAGDSHVTADGGNSWLSTSTDGPFYLPANAGVLFMSGSGDANGLKNQPYGFVSALRSGDLGGNGAIGFGGAIVADRAGVTCWGGIMEIQREAGAGSVYGWELAVKNKGNNAFATPNSLATGGPSGAYGLWLQGGGDSSFGGAPANPSTAGIAFLGGASTWNSGIVFASDAITGSNAIQLSAQGSGGAHAIKWVNGAGYEVFSILSDATDTNAFRLQRSNVGFSVYTGASEMFRISGPGGNGIQMYAAAAGNPVQILAIGADTNVDIQLTPKGAGLARFGAFTSNADAPITGYITIKDSSGTARKLAIIA